MAPKRSDRAGGTVPEDDIVQRIDVGKGIEACRDGNGTVNFAQKADETPRERLFAIHPQTPLGRTLYEWLIPPEEKR